MALEYGASNGSTVILFVDDNMALLRSVERLLRLEGFEVLLASDGLEALKRLETAAPLPDLIISDIGMPRMDGFALFEQVRDRSEWLHIPFLFLTARDQQQDLQRGYMLGADDYLVKPLDHERLLLVICSKLKRREEMLTHIRSQQNVLESAMNNLSVMVAHELRTPLMTITMVADILARELDSLEPDQVADMLNTMQGGSVRLGRLVEQMVMYVQMESGTLNSARHHYTQVMTAAKLVRGSVDRAQQFNYRQRVSPLEIELGAPDVCVRCDQSALRHALAELVLNAFGFSAPDARIVVTQWGSDHWMGITVSDAGPGIPEDELDHVFRPFYQVNRRRYEQQGIGIGLTLAKKVVEAHGGDLQIQSTLGQGTLVRVTLPVA